MPQLLRKRESIVICFLLALITIVVYAQILGHEFVDLDDNGYVFYNNHVKAGLTADTMRWAFTTFTEANWHPLTWLSHALDCQLYGQKAGWHHLTSLLFHLLNALLVFFLFGKMTGRPWPSAFVAALFAIHPLHVESVAWVAERKDVLSAFFWLLTMLAYVSYVRQSTGITLTPTLSRQGRGGHARLIRYLLVLLAFALGLMAKPMLVSLPFALLLMDYWPLGRWQPGRAWKLIAEKAPMLALTIGSSVVTFLAQKDIAVAPLERYSVGVRVANAVVAYTAYLKKMVWPSDMSVFYGHPGKTLPEWQIVLSLALLVGLSVLAFKAGRRKPYLITGWLWYVITLVPVIGLVQVGNQAMADRYTYIPLLGIFIAIAWAVPDLFPKSEPAKMSRQARRAAKRSGGETEATFRVDLAVPAVLIIVVLMAVTYTQAAYWKDTATLFAHTTSIFPKDAAAHALVAQKLDEEGKDDEAIEEYRKAVDINPRNVDAQLNLGVLLAKKAQEEIGPSAIQLTDEAIESFSGIVRIKPNHAKARKYLGNQLMKRGRYKEAVEHLRQAIRIAPRDPESYCYMGLVMHNLQRIGEADGYYRKAIAIRPDYKEAHENLAIILYIERRFAEAWKEVHLSRRYGGEPNADFVKALSGQMVEE
ncbi:MAG: tetratricopeptide repeat protein [Armatimonadota bacterium]|nr:tetratricopeptide repeat protein [Armatimonadota bacterium]